MRIQYSGPLGGPLEVFHRASNTYYDVERDVPLEVPDDLGAELVGRGDFVEVDEDGNVIAPVAESAPADPPADDEHQDEEPPADPPADETEPPAADAEGNHEGDPQ